MYEEFTWARVHRLKRTNIAESGDYRVAFTSLYFQMACLIHNLYKTKCILTQCNVSKHNKNNTNKQNKNNGSAPVSEHKFSNATRFNYVQTKQYIFQGGNLFYNCTVATIIWI